MPRKNEWVEYKQGKKYLRGIFLKEKDDKYLIQTSMGSLLLDKRKVRK